jgi:septum formation protein
MPNLVLASKSPRRSEILRNAGIDFVVRTADVEEIHQPGETPIEYVRRLSRSKAWAVLALMHEVVLGADTVVVVDDVILEKPSDAADAGRMLRMLSGRTHDVITGISLRKGEHTITDHATTEVTFATWTEMEIHEYVESGEPMDKAGAYAIQGLASKLVTSIKGCYFNVVGLPVSLVYQRWKELGS